LSALPHARLCRRPPKWRDETINITVHGVLQNKISHATPHYGRIGFQLEGIPFELRAVRLTPL